MTEKPYQRWRHPPGCPDSDWCSGNGVCYWDCQGDLEVETMSQKDIQDWLRYWQATKSVAVHNINAFDQVAEARKYCSCMREGAFSEVSDLQIWRALCNMRDGQYPESPK